MDTISSLLTEFAARIRAAALAEVVATLQGTTPKPERHKSAPKAKGEKRSPADLAELTEKLHAEIRRGPGRRMEQIAKDVGFTTQELALPAKKLLAAGRIRTTGQRRATKYWPKGGK